MGGGDNKYLVKANLGGQLDHTLLDSDKLVQVISTASTEVLSEMCALRGLPMSGPKHLMQERLLQRELGVCVKWGHKDMLNAVCGNLHNLGLGGDTDDDFDWAAESDDVSQAASDEALDRFSSSPHESESGEHEALDGGGSSSPDDSSDHDAGLKRPVSSHHDAGLKRLLEDDLSADFLQKDACSELRVATAAESEDSDDAGQDASLSRSRARRPAGVLQTRINQASEWVPASTYDDPPTHGPAHVRPVTGRHRHAAQAAASSHSQAADAPFSKRGKTGLDPPKPKRGAAHAPGARHGRVLSPVHLANASAPRDCQPLGQVKTERLLHTARQCQETLASIQSLSSAHDPLPQASSEDRTTLLHQISDAMHSDQPLTIDVTDDLRKIALQGAGRQHSRSGLPPDRVEQAKQAGKLQYSYTLPGRKQRRPLATKRQQQEQAPQVTNLDLVDTVECEPQLAFCLDLAALWSNTDTQPARRCGKFKPASNGQPAVPHQHNECCPFCPLECCQKGQCMRVVSLKDLAEEMRAKGLNIRQPHEAPAARGPQGAGATSSPVPLTPDTISDFCGMPVDMFLRLNGHAWQREDRTRDRPQNHPQACNCVLERHKLSERFHSPDWAINDAHMPDSSDADAGEGQLNMIMHATFVPEVGVANHCDDKFHVLEKQYKAMTYWRSCPLTPDVSLKYHLATNSALQADSDITLATGWGEFLARVKHVHPSHTVFHKSVLGAGLDDLVIWHIICILHGNMAMTRGMLHLTQVSQWFSPLPAQSLSPPSCITSERPAAVRRACPKVNLHFCHTACPRLSSLTDLFSRGRARAAAHARSSQKQLSYPKFQQQVRQVGRAHRYRGTAR